MRSSHETAFLAVATQVLLGLAALILALVGGTPVSRAEPPGGADRKNQIGLFLWVPGIDGLMTIGGNTVPIDITTGDSLKELNLGGPLAYSRTPEPWGALATMIFVDMESAFTTLVNEQPGEQGIRFFMTDLVANRRWPFANNKVGVELILGLRYWKLEQSFMIENGPRFENDASWYDGVVGGRVTVQMAKNWWFMGRLDGATGGSDQTLNAETMFQWRMSRLLSLAFGYRLVNVKYETGSDARFELDADIHGPTATFLFSF